jgi:hypothetical protein
MIQSADTKTYVLIPIHNQTLLQHVDAIEFYSGHNPFIKGLSSLDYTFHEIRGALMNLNCYFRDTMLHEEWSVILPLLTPPQEHLEYTNRVIPSLTLFTGEPEIFTTLGWSALPYGNRFGMFDNGGGGTYEIIPGTLTSAPQLELLFSVAFPYPGNSLPSLFVFFDLDLSGNLFRTVNMTIQISKFGFAPLMFCLPPHALGPTITLYDQFFIPIGMSGIFDLTVTSTTMTGTLVLDFGSNAIGQIQFDPSTILCDTVNPGPGIDVYRLRILEYSLTADGSCLPPVEPVLCRNVIGRAFKDLNENGLFDPNSDEALPPGTIVTVDQAGYPYTRYYTVSPSNGTYVTDCLPVDTPLTITVQSPVGFQVIQGVNPQVYIANGSLCRNQAPDVLYSDTNGLGARLYYDLNGNGVQDMGEPGIEGITVVATTGIVSRSNVTDMFGNVIIDGVPSGPTVFDIITLPQLFGYFLTQGDDPTALEVVMSPNRTIVGPFGFAFPSLPCTNVTPATVVIDSFETPNRPPIVSQQGSFRDHYYLSDGHRVIITGSSSWTILANQSIAMLYSAQPDPTQLTLSYTVDLTFGSGNNALVLEILSLYNPTTSVHCAIYVGTEQQQQQTIAPNGLLSPGELVFYIDAVNVSQVTLVCDTDANTALVLDSIEARCAACIADTNLTQFPAPVRIVTFLGLTSNCSEISIEMLDSNGTALPALPLVINVSQPFPVYFDAGSDVIGGYRVLNWCTITASNGTRITTDSNNCNTFLDRAATIIPFRPAPAWFAIAVAIAVGALVTIVCACCCCYRPVAAKRCHPHKHGPLVHQHKHKCSV